MLARYIAQLASGQARLPDELSARFAVEAQAERGVYRGSPRAPNPLREPRRFAQYWSYPNRPCRYRKDEVGRDPEALDRGRALGRG